MNKRIVSFIALLFVVTGSFLVAPHPKIAAQRKEPPPGNPRPLPPRQWEKKNQVLKLDWKYVQLRESGNRFD